MILKYIAHDTLVLSREDVSSYPVAHNSGNPPTFFGTAAICIGPRVRSVFRISCRGTLFCPVKIISIILGEQTNITIFKSTVKLSC